MASRALDYYTEGLPIEVRQKLFHHMKDEISPTMIRWFLEKDDGYPSFHSCGFSDDNIASIGATYVEKFELANQVMADNERPPLFSDPHDSYKSAQEYMQIMRERSDEELAGIFGPRRNGTSLSE